MSLSNAAASLAAATLFLAAGAVRADVILYTSQASFLAAVANAGTDTYNDMANTVHGPTARTAGSYSYTMATYVGSADGLPDQDDYIHPFSFDGSNTFIVSNNAGQAINFTGFTNVSAIGGNLFGLRASGSASTPVSVYVTVYDASGYHDWNLSGVTSSSFLGVVSTSALTGFAVNAFSAGPGAVLTAVDNLTLAQAVPEPQSYALMLGGLGLMGFLLAGRRSRRAD